MCWIKACALSGDGIPGQRHPFAGSAGDWPDCNKPVWLNKESRSSCGPILGTLSVAQYEFGSWSGVSLFAPALKGVQ